MEAVSNEVGFKEIQNIIKEELKQFVALKVWRENKKEVEQAGVDGPLFMVLSKADQQNELKYRQIQRALDFALDDIEREIITQKFLDPSKPTDMFIYLELGLKKAAYYSKKKEAIYSMAKALGIV